MIVISALNNIFRETLLISELDRELGYNYLKKCKFEMKFGIFQIFQSLERESILIISNKGDLLSYNFTNEQLKVLGSNPNTSNAFHQQSKTKSSEVFDNGERIAVSMDNGDFLVYELNYTKDQTHKTGMQVMIGPFDKEKVEIYQGLDSQVFGSTFNDTGKLVSGATGNLNFNHTMGTINYIRMNVLFYKTVSNWIINII